MEIGIHSYIDIRKESFGCIVYDKTTGRVRQFNHDALRVFSLLTTPSTVDDLVIALQDNQPYIEKEALFSFLVREIEVGILNSDNPTKHPGILLNERVSYFDNALAAPFACTIYITEECSKACRHCITSSSPKSRQLGELTVKQWKEAIQKLRSAGVMHLIFTGGEPLQKDGIFEILQHASDFGFYISLLTDLDEMTQETIDKICKITGVGYVQTSIDGSKPETHEFLRGKGAFEKALNRLALLRDSGLKYTMSVAVHKKNIGEIYDIALIAKKFNAATLYLNPLAPYGRAKKLMQEHILEPEELRQLASIYYDLIVNHGIVSGNAFWEEIALPENRSKFNPDTPFSECLDAVSTASVLMSLNSEGDIYLDSKLKSEGILRLGNIINDDIEAAWSSKRLNALRKNYKRGKPVTLVNIELARQSN